MFHYDDIKNNNDSKSKLLFTDTDTSMYAIKAVDFYEDYSAKSKYRDDSNKLVNGKMKDEIDGVAIKEFVGLKPKMYSFLTDHNREHKKGKGMNRNVATIIHNEYKDVLLNNKCLRHSMNRIQSTDHSIRTYEISKSSSSCFDNKIYIQNNGYEGLTLGYLS